MAKAQKRPKQAIETPVVAPFEQPYKPTAFETVYEKVVRNEVGFRYGTDTLNYFEKQNQGIMPRSAEDLARNIWNAIGGDRLGDGFVAQYLFKLATQSIDKVMKAIVEYAREKFGETAANVTDVTLERLSKMPFDQFKVEFEKIMALQVMTKWQRFWFRVVKIFR